MTWIYAKDVHYTHFGHIRQAHNGHPVGNMWNGMNFPSETGREVIERYVTTSSTSSALGYPRNYYENFNIPNVRGADGNSDTRSNASYRGRGNFAMRGAPRGGRGMSRGGFNNVPPWHFPAPRVLGPDHEVEDDHTPTATSTGGRFPADRRFLSGPAVFSTDYKWASPTFSMDDLKNAPVAGNATLLPGEPVTFVMGPDGRLSAVPASADKKPMPAQFNSSGQSSTFGARPSQSTRLAPVNPSSHRGGRGPGSRGGHHAPNGRFSQNIHPDTAHAARPHRMGHGQSPSVALLNQAAILAAQQDAQLRDHYPSAPPEQSWDYHSQQMASLGFQNDNYDARMHQDSSDDYDELPTPTHRPPPHASRHEPHDDGEEFDEDSDILTYRDVPGWQHNVVRGMGHLQLKALFFTLSAEQHILEYRSMKPSITTREREAIMFRMRRAAERKREVADEVSFTPKPGKHYEWSANPIPAVLYGPHDLQPPSRQRGLQPLRPCG